MSVTEKPLLQAKVYFENLNAIRFIAAFLVIIHHVEQLKHFYHYPSHWENPFINVIGTLGVVLFFVLSGFLISYLLFKEKEVTGTISIKDFYLRRVYRIWPLYFLIIILAFSVFPFIPQFAIPGLECKRVLAHLAIKLFLFVFFLPNMVLAKFGIVPYASQTWSIGAEEQFYLLWPALNKKTNNRWLLMLGTIAVYLLVAFALYFMSNAEPAITFKEFWSLTPLDCMAIGGLFAVIVYQQDDLTVKIRKFLFSAWLQWATLITVVVLIGVGVKFPVLHKEIYSVLFGVLISNFAVNPKRIFSMENAVTNHLGKISYGLYMFHVIAIVFCMRLFEKFHLPMNFLLSTAALLLTTIIASVSYRYFESYFLKMKIAHTKILSGDSVKHKI